MLAAFNLQHLKYDEAEAKQYDTEAMTADYECFCQLEQEEILRYKNKEKKDDRGTIGAEEIRTSIINVSVQSVDIVNNLPKLKFD